MWLCNTEGNAGWSLQRKFILVVRPNDRSKTNCDVAIQLYDPEDIWQLCCSLRIVWFSVSYADLFVWPLWKLLKNACDLWREWHNPMTKDKLQDQKFIIYKAIRYLMSDISMQYHNRDEFSLLWSAFQTLYRQVFYLAVSICPKTGFRRNLWHNPSTCLWRGNKFI